MSGFILELVILVYSDGASILTRGIRAVAHDHSKRLQTMSSSMPGGNVSFHRIVYNLRHGHLQSA